MRGWMVPRVARELARLKDKVINNIQEYQIERGEMKRALETCYSVSHYGY